MESAEDIIIKLQDIAEECQYPAELSSLLDRCIYQDRKPIAYNGFEPSGQMHIASGVLTSMNVNTLLDCGIHVKMWIADWFAMLNGKYDGDLKKIRATGEYMIEVWKACGMKIDQVEFLWASEEINKKPQEYWMGVMKIASNKNISKLEKCTSIMGRGGENRKVSTILYPLIQCNNVFFLNCDILQLGIDQRKVNMLARETASLFNKPKPIILSHHVLKGLKQGQDKMSKSDPSSSIYITDTSKQVEKKIRKAFCMVGDVNKNPILDYTEHLIIPCLRRNGEMFIVEKGEDIYSYNDSKELVSDYMNKLIHPAQLKRAVIKHLNQILDPIRRYFSENPAAGALLDQIKQF